MAESGADPKSIQFSLRHSRVSTSMDIYAHIDQHGYLCAVRTGSTATGSGANDGDARRAGRKTGSTTELNSVPIGT
jgi:hypothetical protein